MKFGYSLIKERLYMINNESEDFDRFLKTFEKVLSENSKIPKEILDAAITEIKSQKDELLESLNSTNSATL
jgi:hypothetical protein